jgi:hypothetical protein
MFYDNPNDILNRARRDEGKVTILGTIATGVNKGHHVCCITPRDELVSGIEMIAALRRHERRGILASIANAVQIATNQRINTYNSSNDANFMADLVLLMAMKMTFGSAVLQGTNLFSLALAIDPDDTLPWDRRGMLSPNTEAELRLDIRPVLIGGSV